MVTGFVCTLLLLPCICCLSVLVYGWRPSRTLAWITLWVGLIALGGLCVASRVEVRAPLEEPASVPATEGHPEVAPLHRLDLQKLMVSVHPWIVTIALPCVPIGLILSIVAMATEIRRGTHGRLSTNGWLTGALVASAIGSLVTLAVAVEVWQNPGKLESSLFGFPMG